MSQPSLDELEDIILSARYGELEEMQQFIARYGIEHIESTRDERGNTCLHMAAANGHIGQPSLDFLIFHPSFLILRNFEIVLDILGYILPLLKEPGQAIAATNDAGNTPLHWASMNGHIEVLKLLVPPAVTTTTTQPSPLFVKNSFGRTALSEAESRGMEKMEDNALSSSSGTEETVTQDNDKESKVPKNKWMDCADYLLSFMELEKEGRDRDSSKNDGSSGKENDEDLHEGVARMGVASKSGGFEYEERKA